MSEDPYLDLTQAYEAMRRFQAEVRRIERQAVNRKFLLAWAQMMHGAPGQAFFGNGVWFIREYQPLVTEVPIRG